ncbi:MAG: hypothetical protein K2X29_00995 [Candidatus Obscuribacterales bacterium]|nr:hypothetical protein [Candidatus Obscuribacterales bacterium]
MARKTKNDMTTKRHFHEDCRNRLHNDCELTYKAIDDLEGVVFPEYALMLYERKFPTNQKEKAVLQRLKTTAKRLSRLLQLPAIKKEELESLSGAVKNLSELLNRLSPPTRNKLNFRSYGLRKRLLKKLDSIDVCLKDYQAIRQELITDIDTLKDVLLLMPARRDTASKKAGDYKWLVLGIARVLKNHGMGISIRGTRFHRTVEEIFDAIGEEAVSVQTPIENAWKSIEEIDSPPDDA